MIWEAVRDYLDEVAASPGRGGYQLAREADRAVERARRSVARLFGAPDPSAVAFTANGTHALNLAIHGTLRPGDHVITTMTEHNSVLRPLASLADAGVITYTAVPVGATGRCDLARFRAAMRPSTRLVVVNHASNVTGAVAPVADLVDIAHGCGALLLLDGAQSAGILDIDLQAAGIDLFAFTGHKSLRGPSGTGGLVVRDPTVIRPVLQGGTGSQSHVLAHPATMPTKLEAGTLNYLGIVGLGAAVDDLARQGVAAVRRRALELTGYCLARLREITQVIVYDVDPDLARVPLISLNVDGLYPSEVCALLDERFGIATRAGLHCAPLMHQVLGTAPHGTLRVSLGATTAEADIDALVDALARIVKDTRAYLR